MKLDGKIDIELGYARPDRQILLNITVNQGTTVESAIRDSGILQQCGDIDLDRNSVGIFGKRCGLETVLRAGDRIEIYRPLVMDPKTARRRRAEDAREKR